MFRRRRALTDPVTIHLDGEALPAERGEPLAAALLAADKTILARSPKLHRPRGPSCFRGGCDGCLARVDGMPNVMLCQTPARGGEQIGAQNVIGSRKADLLRVTDWFFAKGIDHHHMLAGVPGLSTVMQGFAAKVAGLGRLPSTVEEVRPARRLAVDVAVVGGGVAGIAAASALAAQGRAVALVDDGLALGGALVGAPASAEELLAGCPLATATVFSHSVAAGFYDGDLLVVTAELEAIVVRARAIVFATGAHDGTLAVPGNDLPGVFSARALCRLVHGGIEPDGPTAIVGDGFWADELARALGDAPVMRLGKDDLVDVRGTAVVRNVTRRAPDTGDLATHAVAVVALALPGAPSFELPAQAGADVRFDPALGYVVVTDDRGRFAPSAWAAGECTGKPFDPRALRAEGQRVAADVHAALGG
ncbi:MAG: 2Fe-2S iron-sulfur cluster-binding protein [Minicystis sp.]